jgi:quercetin dioxygenase-like cupin family protein
MKVGKLNEFYRGWVIGNFEPSLYKTENFEVGILHHPKGEVWPAHYHKLATEYNILISGTMTLCGQKLEPGNTFILDPYEVADPTFHEDCTIVCIKVPSDTKDKYTL